MDSERHGPRPAPSRPQEEYACPACGRPVGTVVKRHKTLGAFVPVWEPGPCHNPDCPLSVERDGVAPGHKASASDASGDDASGDGASGDGASGEEEVGRT